MSKILITGSKGQLGSEFKILEPTHPEHQFIFTDADELDITDLVTVENFVARHRIDCIINCAAYTNVDKAETEREFAEKINAYGPANLAQAAKISNSLLIHISTDYVFDGKSNIPYKESDPVNPQGHYGTTKLAGEEAILKSGAMALIIRTAWLYSAFGHNFVKTMRKYGSERGELRIVADQTGTPTYAADFAAAIIYIIPKYNGSGSEIYHYSNSGITTWYEFACEIVKLSEISCDVHPITTVEYPFPTPRPMYSVLDKSKIIRDFGLKIPPWQESLRRCIYLL